MALSNSQRQNKRRDAITAAGGKRFTSWLSAESGAALDDIVARSGLTKQKVLENIILEASNRTKGINSEHGFPGDRWSQHEKYLVAGAGSSPSGEYQKCGKLFVGNAVYRIFGKKEDFSPTNRWAFFKVEKSERKSGNSNGFCSLKELLALLEKFVGM